MYCFLNFQPTFSTSISYHLPTSSHCYQVHCLVIKTYSFYLPLSFHNSVPFNHAIYYVNYFSWHTYVGKCSFLYFRSTFYISFSLLSFVRFTISLRSPILSQFSILFLAFFLSTSSHFHMFIYCVPFYFSCVLSCKTYPFFSLFHAFVPPFHFSIHLSALCLLLPNLYFLSIIRTVS